MSSAAIDFPLFSVFVAVCLCHVSFVVRILCWQPRPCKTVLCPWGDFLPLDKEHFLTQRKVTITLPSASLLRRRTKRKFLCLSCAKKTEFWTPLQRRTKAPQYHSQESMLGRSQLTLQSLLPFLQLAETLQKPLLVVFERVLAAGLLALTEATGTSPFSAQCP